VRRRLTRGGSTSSAGSGRRRLPALERPPKRDKVRIGSGTYANRCTMFEAHNELHIGRNVHRAINGHTRSPSRVRVRPEAATRV
jgi:hypothetical protein